MWSRALNHAEDNLFSIADRGLVLGYAPADPARSMRTVKVVPIGVLATSMEEPACYFTMA